MLAWNALLMRPPPTRPATPRPRDRPRRRIERGYGRLAVGIATFRGISATGPSAFDDVNFGSPFPPTRNGQPDLGGQAVPSTTWPEDLLREHITAGLSREPPDCRP